MKPNTTHTPGPWTVDQTWNLITADGGTIEVAACHTGERMHHKANSTETASANARLIAAAPDLLESAIPVVNAFTAIMLRSADEQGEVTFAETCCPSDKIMISLEVQQWEKLLDAVRKAKGQ